MLHLQRLSQGCCCISAASSAPVPGLLLYQCRIFSACPKDAAVSMLHLQCLSLGARCSFLPAPSVHRSNCLPSPMTGPVLSPSNSSPLRGPLQAWTTEALATQCCPCTSSIPFPVNLLVNTLLDSAWEYWTRICLFKFEKHWIRTPLVRCNFFLIFPGDLKRIIWSIFIRLTQEQWFLTLFLPRYTHRMTQTAIKKRGSPLQWFSSRPPHPLLLQVTL